MITFTTVTTDPERLGQYVRLFADCFRDSNKFSIDYLRWLYEANPTGHAVGFDAFDGQRLVAHYTVIPVELEFAGQQMFGCWSLNTATHPTHQGKGLFTTLAEKTYQAAREKGYVAVIGVANQNSVGGFTKKLGFHLHGQLTVKVGFGSVSITTNSSMRRRWTADLLGWRLRNPSQVYLRRDAGENVTIYTRRGITGLPILLGHVDSAVPIVKQLKPLPTLSALQPRVMVGFGVDFAGVAAAIPTRMLPSPWNVIYRPLALAGSRMPPLSILAIDLDTF